MSKTSQPGPRGSRDSRKPREESGVLPGTLLLVASGTLALIFQVLWIKQLTLIVGVEVYAVTTGVSAFFGGLALGGLVLGRRADRARRPLRFYASLEAAVAVMGVATTLALAHTASIFAELETQSSVLAWTLLFVLVGATPFLMGGTLPAIMRSLSLQENRVSSGGGRMYAANTAGAILGALGCSFLLIPSFGIRGSAFAAAGIGLCAAVVAFWLSRSASPAEPVGQPEPLAEKTFTALAFYSVAGGLALGYEVIWSQSIVQFMSTRSFAFSVMLATYLAGLALGAALFARWSGRVRNPWGTFGLLIASAGLVAMLEVTFLGPWLSGLQSTAENAVLSLAPNRLAGMCTRFAVAALCIVFVPTLFLGAAFPAALRLIVRPGHVGRDVGRVVALNTIGGIAGSLLTGFVLMPQLGLVKSLGILAICAALLGSLAARRDRSGWNKTRIATVAIAIAGVGAAVLTPSDRFANLLENSRTGSIVYYKEGQGGTVAVLEQGTGSKRFRRLYIQGISNTGDAMPSLRYMRLQALLPLIIHGQQPKSALVIGLGTGITSGALLRFAGLEQRVVSELLPEVLEAASRFAGNYGVTSDPRMDIRLRDGRRELLSNEQSYDLITLEPPPPSAAGVVNLYSSDFYRLARARLRPGGIVAQWLPLPTQNDEDTRSLVRSFLDVYPHASLWTTEVHEMLLVGSLEPVILDVQSITQRFNDPGVAQALREVGIGSPAALLATWITDRAGLEAYAGDALPVTDDQPRIEYADWVRSDELQRVLPRLIGLRTEPQLRGADRDFAEQLALERQRLLVFYQAVLNAQAGHRDLWARDMGRLLESDGENAYYRWFGKDHDQATNDDT